MHSLPQLNRSIYTPDIKTSWTVLEGSRGKVCIFVEQIYNYVHPFQKLPHYSIPSSGPLSTIGAATSPLWVILGQGEVDDENLVVLLNKILLAIGVDLETEVFQIVLQTQEAFSISNSLEQAETGRIVLAFGIGPSSLGMATRTMLNERFILNSHQFIFSDTLSTIRDQSDRKRALWNSLQELNIR